MENNIFGINGLRFWNKRDIQLRNMFKERFSLIMKENLLNINPAWNFVEIEAPLLTPRKFINKDYSNEDIWVQERTNENDEELVLRPETTPGSYIASKYLMDNENYKPPFVVEQFGKSFRREQDQPNKHCRFKEFYQQEFQCLYTSDTKNDYQKAILEPVRVMINEIINLPTRIIESDRTPKYSELTMDIEVDNGDKFMEVCSISKRLDYPYQAIFTNKKNNQVKKDLFVLEIAIGIDRCVYNFNRKEK